MPGIKLMLGEASITRSRIYQLLIGKETSSGLASQIPVEDESFDFVFSSHVLEHMQNTSPRSMSG